MEINEAIKKARKDLGMSQQKLADLAGIERKQLSILENGGNVTLATIRKIVEHLPNMESFTLGSAAGHVLVNQSPEAQRETLRMMGRALQTVFSPFLRGRLPNEEDGKELQDVTREVYRSMGFTDEDFQRELAASEARLPPPKKLTAAETVAALAELDAALDQTEEAFAQMELEEQAEAAEKAKDRDRR
jgi:transcriptional regulator with XRE-family HTH domain